MSHFYEINDGATLLEGVETPAQAGKASIASGNPVYASNTTKLAIAPNPFLQLWKEREICRVAQAHPHLTYDEVKEEVWKKREGPDGRMYSSRDFGSKVHFEIEQHLTGGIMSTDWKMYAKDVVEWSEQFNSVICEQIFYDDELLLASTVDFIGFKGSKITVADFKTREIKDAKRIPCYDADGMQLALNSYMVGKRFDNEIDKIVSIIIDVDSGKAHYVNYTLKKHFKMLKMALATNRYYNDFVYDAKA